MLTTGQDTIRIGFIRLMDAAPLIIGGELGFFKKAGLRVELRRQLGWSALEHKLVLNELDAAHTLAPLPLAVNSGVAEAKGRLRAPLAISYLGNAITLSNDLKKRGVETVDDFRREVLSRRIARKYTLGYVAPYSSHYSLIRMWLKSAGVNADKDVKLVVVPPGQALRTLRAGVLDGYCVGEPWNSLAIAEGIGWCPAWSTELAPDHVEKVLAFPESWYAANQAIATALIAALIEACDYCSAADNFPEIAAIMSQKACLSVSEAHLISILKGRVNGDHKPNGWRQVIAFRRDGSSNDVQPHDKAWLSECVAASAPEGMKAEQLTAIAETTYS